MSDRYPPEPGDPGIIDLGNDHWLRYTSLNSDDELLIQRFGAVIFHVVKPRKDPGWKTSDGRDVCIGSIKFSGDLVEKFAPQHVLPTWVVERWDPLTISPSILCDVCGDHGFIHRGKWERV